MLNYFSVTQIVVLTIFSLISGPVGVMTSWLRISFLIDVLSHSAIFGISLNKYFDINQSITIFCSNILIALVVFFSKKKNESLAVISQISVAAGMMIMFLSGSNVNHMHYLCGHMHGVSNLDLIVISILVFFITLIMIFWKKQVFLTILSEELAFIAGYKVNFIKFFSLLTIVLLVTESSKIAGILSSSAIFLIPPIFLDASVKYSMLLSSLISVCSMILSIFLIELHNLPIGPTIVICVLVVSISFKIITILFTKSK